MLSIDALLPYQQKAIEFQASHPASALWLDMGLGKTVITLSSALYLIRSGKLKAVLIVAPIRVCRLVWRQESAKWKHTVGLTFSMMTGNRDQRTRALLQSADIYLINYENLGWLTESLMTYYVSKNVPIPFDGIVFDEINKCKNSSSLRVQQLRKILSVFKWRTGLTGTPAGNGYRDLHGQYLVLDDGKRLGESKTRFETRWYKSDGPWKKKPYNDTEHNIKKLIGDITLEMSAGDYNPLPDLIMNDITVDLSPYLREQYDQMEKELFIKLDNGREIELFNQAALTNECLQFANGALYLEPGKPDWQAIHSLKLDALEEIVDENNGQPILCSYAFRSDAARILERFKRLRPINLTECKSERSLVTAMKRWREGDCPLMIGHPGSMGHGLDGLQHHGQTLVWFGLNWSLDLYEQFTARIRRQGQGAPVISHRILCNDTLDQAQMIALDGKAKTQDSLRNAIKKYRMKRDI